MNCQSRMFAWSARSVLAADQAGAYFLARACESTRMAAQASDARARLAHYELAGRYSIEAVRAARTPVEADWSAGDWAGLEVNPDLALAELP